MTYSAASPVSVAIFGLLQNATLLATLAGGFHDDVPQNPTYPFGWYEIGREQDARGFGTSGLPLIDLRTHVFSLYGGKAEAQEANRLTIGALKDVALSVTGYAMCGRIFYDDTIEIPDEELNGVKVHEIVSNFRIYAEES